MYLVSCIDAYGAVSDSVEFETLNEAKEYIVSVATEYDEIKLYQEIDFKLNISVEIAE